jgi:hypothetical protein
LVLHSFIVRAEAGVMNATEERRAKDARNTSRFVMETSLEHECCQDYPTA